MAAFVGPAAAQEGPPLPDGAAPAQNGRLAVFLDCDDCDDEHIRREITFVHHVTERERADVHVLVTEESTGSGGNRFTFHLIGQGNFEGEQYDISYFAPPSSTEDERRGRIAQTLEVALAPFLMRTPLVERMSLHIERIDDEANVPQDDPWNGWTIEIFGDGSGDLEESQHSLHLESGIVVNRITEEWKVELEPFFAYSVDYFEQDDERITSSSHEGGFEGEVIRSISEHWSVGQFADVFTSTFENIDLRLQAFPAVEYSVYPYRESSRRRLTFVYRAGLGYVQYRDTTIFNRLEEITPQHALEADYELIQRWGQMDLGLEASQHLNDLSNYRIELEGGLEVRLSRGLSLHLGVEMSVIFDQLNLPKEDATLEELLLRRRELATSYEMHGSVGFRYRFGSIYNNVVNTRF